MKSLSLENAPQKKRKPTKKVWTETWVLSRKTMGIKTTRSSLQKKRETATTKRSRISEPFQIYSKFF
jgi:hypothetical protein